MFELTPVPNATVYPAADPSFILAIKILAGVTSSFSIIGGCVIILTYMFCEQKWERSVARQIIVMLSVADILVAISHIWGASQGLERYLSPYVQPGQEPIDNDEQCIVQAVLAVYGTIASFMWSWMLVFLMCCITTFQGRPAELFLSFPTVVIYQALCWGAPFVLVIVLASNSLLGFGEGTDIGWCFVSLKSLNETSDTARFNTLVWGYEVWTWLLLFLIAFFSIAFLVVGLIKKHWLNRNTAQNTTLTESVRDKPAVTPRTALLGQDTDVSGSSDHIEVDLNVANTQFAGWKFVVAAALLILLRSFNTIVDIGLLISHESYKELWVAVMVAFAAVGNSVQGFLNMFIFVIVTPQVLPKTRCNCLER